MIESKNLCAPQILSAFDEHMDVFTRRIRKLEKDIETEAYRQTIDSLVAKINTANNIIEGMNRVFDALKINPHEHPAWTKR